MWVSQPLRPASSLSDLRFPLPRLSCDAHMHVFGPISRYPSIPDPKYTKPEGSLAEYEAVAERLGFDRMVFVQASFYGTDNACILDAMASVGARSRGVVILAEDTPAARLDELHRGGVRGLRLDLFRADRDGKTMADVLAMLAKAQGIAKQLGWHVEFYAPGLWVRKLLPQLGDLDVDYSINHMGYMTKAEGLTDDDVRRFIELTRHDRCWGKLTGPYRGAQEDDQARADWIARELVASAPDRLVWGTDWPHIPNGGRDTGELLNRLETWCPDEQARTRILVDNPARLYGFD